MKKIEDKIPEVIPIPEGLSERSSKMWETVLPRVRTPERRLLLESGLRWLDQADAFNEVIQQKGLFLSERKNSKMRHLNPLVKLQSNARLQFTKIWQNLGLHYERHADFPM